jgi:hypothetical protein
MRGRMVGFRCAEDIEKHRWIARLPASSVMRSGGPSGKLGGSRRLVRERAFTPVRARGTHDRTSVRIARGLKASAGVQRSASIVISLASRVGIQLIASLSADRSRRLMPPRNRYLDARRPWIPEMGYVLQSDAERKRELENDFNARSICSQQVNEIPGVARRQPLLCFISFSRGLVTHVARSEVRYTAQSGWDRLDLWNLTELDQSVRISSLAANLGDCRT